MAVQCAYYGIPLNKVYSHADISRMYPQDTNHTDPIAFFKSVGVSWSAFKGQIKKYYDVLVVGGDTTKITSLGANKPAVTASKSSTNTNAGIVKKYAEKGVFYPNETIIVRDAPSTKANIVARYHKGENLTYHTVHIGNGYVWLEYLRNNGKSGFIPIREYKNGKPQELWGSIK